MSSYEAKFYKFLDNHCCFLGILSGVQELKDPQLTWQMTCGGNMSSATLVITMHSRHLNRPYYAVLQRQSSTHVEWFDPTGMFPPDEVIQWCKENDLSCPCSLKFPLLAPDRLFLSGEMCAYYVKQRKWADSMDSFLRKLYDLNVTNCTNLVLCGVDFSA